MFLKTNTNNANLEVKIKVTKRKEAIVKKNLFPKMTNNNKFLKQTMLSKQITMARQLLISLMNSINI